MEGRVTGLGPLELKYLLAFLSPVCPETDLVQSCEGSDRTISQSSRKNCPYQKRPFHGVSPIPPPVSGSYGFELRAHHFLSIKPRNR